jgi:hypothetical protein
MKEVAVWVLYFVTDLRLVPSPDDCGILSFRSERAAKTSASAFAKVGLGVRTLRLAGFISERTRRAA